MTNEEAVRLIKLRLVDLDREDLDYEIWFDRTIAALKRIYGEVSNEVSFVQRIKEDIDSTDYVGNSRIQELEKKVIHYLYNLRDEIEQNGRVQNDSISSGLEPKPPQILQNIKWILLYGNKHWKIVAIAILLLITTLVYNNAIDETKEEFLVNEPNPIENHPDPVNNATAENNNDVIDRRPENELEKSDTIFVYHLTESKDGRDIVDPEIIQCLSNDFSSDEEILNIISKVIFRKPFDDFYNSCGIGGVEYIGALLDNFDEIILLKKSGCGIVNYLLKIAGLVIREISLNYWLWTTVHIFF